MLERDGRASFEDACRKKFQYYFELLDVFADRASARPLLTSDGAIGPSIVDCEDLTDPEEDEIRLPVSDRVQPGDIIRVDERMF